MMIFFLLFSSFYSFLLINAHIETETVVSFFTCVVTLGEKSKHSELIHESLRAHLLECFIQVKTKLQTICSSVSTDLC